jgi:hypothetical protein
MSNGTHGEGMICRASLRALSVVDMENHVANHEQTMKRVSSTSSASGQLPAILRFHAREGNVFDTSNDTVIVTRALLRDSAQEIETLRNFLNGIQKMTNLALLDAEAIEEARELEADGPQRGSQESEVTQRALRGSK